MPKPKTADEYLEINSKLEQERSYWNTHYQLVAEYILQRKAVFTTQEEPGSFINSEVWTDLPAKSAETAASALLGLIWPDSYSFQLKPTKEYEDDEEVKLWLQEATKDLQNAMDDPEAGLSLALDEVAIDYLVFGTPALHVEEGTKTEFRFDAWNVSQFYIDEGEDNYIDTFYRRRKYTVRQAVSKFGLENLSKKTQSLYEGKKLMEKIDILHVIAPREVNPKLGPASKNLPIASVWLEVDQKHIIREGGYHELPTFAARYSKRIGEKYGRSPGMRALPTIMELNALWEIVTIGLEKNFDPPLAVQNDGVLGGGTLDTSAGAINVLNMTAGYQGNRPPIETLYTVGSFNDVAVLIERLENTIADHFMIDILLDLQNDKEMTAREYLGRAAVRQRTVRSPTNRFTSEILNRMIERCFNIMLRKGRFGYAANSPEFLAAQAADPEAEIKTIPEKIVEAQGKQERVYRIRYNTPSARERQSEEAQGIFTLYEFMGSVAAYDQSVFDIPNNERAIKYLGDIVAVPQELYNTEDELEELRRQKVEAQSQQQQLDQAQQVASIAKDAAAAQGEFQ